MDQQTRKERHASRMTFSDLEPFVRGKIQEMLQTILDEEVSEFLGREKSARRLGPEQVGYRNGYGKQRKLTLSCGTVSLRRPRVRGTQERFESRLLPLFVRKSGAVSDLLPQLYLHGLSLGDFDLALRGLLGEGAPLSASTVARLKEKWKAEYEEWATRRLDELKPVYLWVDGVYVKAGLEKEKAALLVVMAALSDGRKVVLSVTPGHRESTESWSAVLRDLRSRGLVCPKLVLGDGHLGIWAALRTVYPEASEQRCWNHRIINILDRIPKKDQAHAKMLLRDAMYAPTKEAAEKAKAKFGEWCRKKGHQKAAALIEEDWEKLVAYYSFPKAHWHHLRTTNPVESPFAALRLRTDAAKRFKKVENATSVIWKMLCVAEQTFRRLRSPELAEEVWKGARYVNGVSEKEAANEVAA